MHSQLGTLALGASIGPLFVGTPEDSVRIPCFLYSPQFRHHRLPEIVSRIRINRHVIHKAALGRVLLLLPEDGEHLIAQTREFVRRTLRGAPPQYQPDERTSSP